MTWSWPQVIAFIVGALLVIFLTNWLMVLFLVPEVARYTAVGVVALIALVILLRSS